MGVPGGVGAGLVGVGVYLVGEPELRSVKNFALGQERNIVIMQKLTLSNNNHYSLTRYSSHPPPVHYLCIPFIVHY